MERKLEDIVVVKITGLLRDDGSKKPLNSDEDILYKFRKESIIKCSSIYSIEKAQLQKKLGTLTSQQMEIVGEKLRNVLELN
jgi:mRNA-degrading endonuclease toxin of MazEF toxin-antitoxin module